MATRPSERPEAPQASRVSSVSSQLSDGPMPSPPARGSTSSWSEEPAPPSMDISTGHMVLVSPAPHGLEPPPTVAWGPDPSCQAADTRGGTRTQGPRAPGARVGVTVWSPLSPPSPRPLAGGSSRRWERGVSAHYVLGLTAGSWRSLGPRRSSRWASRRHPRAAGLRGRRRAGARPLVGRLVVTWLDPASRPTLPG